MTWTTYGWSVAGCLLLGALAGAAQDADAPRNALPAESPLNVVGQIQPVQDKQGDKKEEKVQQPPAVDFSQAQTSAEAPEGLKVRMIGDPPPLFRLVSVQVPTFGVVRIRGNDNGLPPFTVVIPTTVSRLVRVPVPTAGGFKIGQNEGVLPEDRAFFTYNFYDNLQGPAQGSQKPGVIRRDLTYQGQVFPGLVFVPAVAPPRVDMQRETLGFEKSFFDGAFSVGLRVPTFQQNGAQDFNERDLGDMTIITKFALWNDRPTGSGISLGLAVTVPTGPDVITEAGNIHSTLLQPFVGYQFNRANFLLFGFTSVVVPTDKNDVTLLYNDIGVGYRLWEGEGLVSSVVPAVEAHLTTPLDHRHASDPIQGADSLVLTSGVHLGLGQRSMLTFGVAAPIGGPHPFNVEAICQFNFRF